MSDSRGQVPTTIFVLFGATGDLAARMVLPAFYQLYSAGLLPEHWALVGNGRHAMSDDEFREHVRDAIAEHDSAPGDDAWGGFARHVRFAGDGFTADDPGRLLDVLAEVRSAVGEGAQLVHYLALPPTTFVDYTKALGAHDLARDARAVYEKPFGTSRESFEELDAAVHDVFDERQVYRIDHFLGKENTQNLHVLRFANGLFEGVWNNRHVAQVQISVPETLGIANRAQFYDATGSVLDMLVTHLFQVAAEIADEPPPTLGADDVQSARESVIAAFRPLDPGEVVLGQFDGYRDTPGVADDSTTDTFVAARLWVDTDRWRGVPFLLRTGKRLATSEQLVSLVFRPPEDGPIPQSLPDGTVLSFDLSGHGTIHLTTTVKEPGPGTKLTLGHMSLPLDSVADASPLAPYARLLHDVLDGDRSLFTRPDGLAHVWEVAAPLLDDPPTPQPYAPGSSGPAAADDLPGDAGWITMQRPPA
ncbi:glucose-6-phosphate dehydrogenase (NADP(+)) [Rhodococcus rhodnii]|uniref:Glucose-6-phosphate 1-dehydrogenase n=2 Tax=Rhodococcus rhodnii TaxID=38312 RepID=R7WRH5_9NOCA|nr:glucose-6-phosphate dehydrogenase (NADP(+)) [Rhodococcus rhodnii]EOM76579.1 glucose-6-phosphate 1-dehydrogenase [Rhodococcus rhodnii LMG 5362]TXG92183.1 glucose-6-phosphate dehydrogenase (NADP(+)) [Rhodococcus rhodnii]